ncbi:hypothetical protein [Streptomyces sp. NPDC006879]|uniref:hypothetical protein n=1 Tax=Streptomyces sp. NPDC006879 TaxID=3364767 RepID=UPI0036868643
MPVSLDKASDTLCLSDAARELGVTRATVTNWHQRRADFPHVESLGGMRYVNRTALYQWLDKGDRWTKIRAAQAKQAPEVRKPRVRRDVAELRRLIAEHEAALVRLHRELRRSLDV